MPTSGSSRAEQSASQQSDRHDRLVDVRDVVAALAQLAAQRRATRVRRRRQVRDGAVGRDADGAPERDEALGGRMVLRPARRCAGAPTARRRGRRGRGCAARGPRPRAPRRALRCDASHPRDTSTSTARRARSARSETLSAAEADRRPGAAIIAAMSARHFVKYTFLKTDPEWRRRPGRAARARQARVHGGLRGLRRRPSAADLLARRHARRRRAAADRRGREPRADPRVPRRARLRAG